MDEDAKSKQNEQAVDNAAINLIRQKISNIYTTEPDAKEERKESDTAKHRSKHQQFMHKLSNSGKSLAEIQTAWHNYYIGLPDDEKHQVWQEFYAEHDKVTKSATPALKDDTEEPKHIVWENEEAVPTKPRTARDIKNEILSRASKPSRRVSKRQHIRSLIFGLSMGGLVVLMLLFGFFNERFIAPFITPSRAVSSTPIIIDPSSTAAGPEPKLIIPKINVELPLIFDEKSVDEKAIQRALEDGVLHYPTTSLPGELGNGAVFGHSSNNILNKGKYKFAFVLLKQLESGDTFMIQHKSKRYVYKVYEKKIVKPEEVSVLGNTDKAATFALITCDPPGTSINRLVVWGEQITPNPSSNVASTTNKESSSPKVLPSNAPTMWQRLWSWLSN
jgi:sortase A